MVNEEKLFDLMTGIRKKLNDIDDVFSGVSSSADLVDNIIRLTITFAVDGRKCVKTSKYKDFVLLHLNVDEVISDMYSDIIKFICTKDKP